MASLGVDVPNSNAPDAPPDNVQVDTLADGMAKATLENATSADKSSIQETSASPCPLRVYTRRQLLALYKSPLVQPPDSMPALKDWFG